MYSWFLTAVVTVSLCMIPVPASDYIIEDRDIHHYDPVKVIDKQEIACLAVNIYHEARGESKDGQIAVAFVTLNRVKSNSYPDTICGVVYQGYHKPSWRDETKMVPIRHRCQFSWYCDGKNDIPKDETGWATAQYVAGSILYGNKHRGLTEGATHYHASYVKPRWTRDRGMNHVGRIGAHIFYRWE